MKQFITLIFLSLFFLLFSACQTTEPAADPPLQTDNHLSSTDFATAKALFENNNCQNCHVNAPVGPPFKGHFPKFSKVANGQTYIINALLYGLQGEITANGQEFNGVMASRANDFNDKEISLLLNYILTGLGDNGSLLSDDFKLITAAQVATERQTQKTSNEVYALRNTLALP